MHIKTLRLLQNELWRKKQTTPAGIRLTAVKIFDDLAGIKNTPEWKVAWADFNNTDESKTYDAFTELMDWWIFNPQQKKWTTK